MPRDRKMDQYVDGPPVPVSSPPGVQAPAVRTRVATPMVKTKLVIRRKE